MKWNAEGSGCGNQLIHLDAGEISSMNYPQNYEQNLDCDWTIQTDAGSHLILRTALDVLDYGFPDRSSLMVQIFKDRFVFRIDPDFSDTLFYGS